MKRLIGVYFSFLVSITLLCTNDREQRAFRRAEFESIKKDYAESSDLIYQKYQQCLQQGGTVNEVLSGYSCKKQAMFFTRQIRHEYDQLVKESGYTNQDYVLDKVDDFWQFLGYEL
ncbi:MAG: hypothetical protein ACXWL2_03615 [Candidatus Chromulinivorax sp.]